MILPWFYFFAVLLVGHHLVHHTHTTAAELAGMGNRDAVHGRDSLRCP